MKNAVAAIYIGITIALAAIGFHFLDKNINDVLKAVEEVESGSPNGQ